MPNKLQVNKARRELAMYFAEKGYIPDSREYNEDPNKPLLFSVVRRIFRSYSRMVQMVEREEQEILDTMKNEEPAPKEPKKEEKPKVEPKAKPTTTASSSKS